MALPTQKSTKGRKRRRTATLGLKKKNILTCPKCKKPIIAHHICSFCGVYAGKKVLKIKSRLDKSRSKKEKQQEES